MKRLKYNVTEKNTVKTTSTAVACSYFLSLLSEDKTVLIIRTEGMDKKKMR